MRTSRISRETAQVVDALSDRTTRATRASLRSFKHEDDSTDASRHDSANLDDAISSPGSSLGKRKREATATPLKELIKQEVEVRRSPRKAPPGSDVEDTSPSSPYQRKPRRQPAKRITGPDGAITFQPPPDWKKTYNTTVTMRKRLLAPVDTMGCEALAETHRSPQDQRLQTLISLMLSSQTKDTVTAAAIKNLQTNLPGGLTLSSLLTVSPEDLNALISKVGFHNNKTNFIKRVAVILRDDFDNDIPSTIEGLVSLPGVGPKMAYLCMSAAWGRDEGIGVDVHVHRITNLWGWHKTRTPEETRQWLEGWLPREKWHEINHLLVGLGQTVCAPVGRRCGECDLAVEGLCPSAEVRGKKVKREVKAEVEVKIEGGDGAVETVEDVVVEKDDVGVKVEADLEENGLVEVQAFAGSVADAEEGVKVEMP